MKVATIILLVSLTYLTCFKSINASESDHVHESDEAFASVIASIMAASNSSINFNDVNNLANRMVPNRTCAATCPTCSTASYVFNALNLNRTGAIDSHSFAGASLIIVYTVIHKGWHRVCNATTNAKPGNFAFHLEQILHEFGNETTNGMNENGIAKLLKEVNEEYGPSHSMTMGRKCFNVDNLLKGVNHTGHGHVGHNHNTYHPATEITPRILENLAKGLCINLANVAHKEEDHFHEILEAINASSKVVMTYQDLNTLAMKVTSNKKCSNCIGCTIPSYVYTSMGLNTNQTLNETNFPTAAMIMTYTLLPEGWALVCNQTAQIKPGPPDNYAHKLLHEFGNETRMQYSTVGIIKMLQEINSTYGTAHPPDGRTCFSATSLLAKKNDTTTHHDHDHDHSGHDHRRKRATDEHNHSSSNITVANNQWYNGSQVFVPLIEKLVKGHCIQASSSSDDHHDHDHANNTTLPDQAFFQRHIFEIYATNGRVNLTGLQNLMTKLKIGSSSGSNSGNSGHDDHSGHDHKRSTREVHNDHQFEGKCYSASQIFNIFKVSSTGADVKQFNSLSPALVQQVATSACNNATVTTNTTVAAAPSAGEVWGYTILAVTVITLTSVAGILIIPCLGHTVIPYVIAYLVGLAVGSLVGDSIMHLIPHSITEHDHSSHASSTSGGLTEEQGRLMKMLVCVVGLYGFYIFETVILLCTKQKKISDAEIGMKDVNSCDNPSFSDGESKTPEMVASSEVKNNEQDGYVSKSGQKIVFFGLTALGIMVVVGDGLHNFTDGIAIGASFKSSLSLGLSTSVAVFCHELPQELGDFAILYASGMGWKRALIYNLISALPCYIGAIIGIFAASTNIARQYMFAVTAGLFLYIALVDLMPQMTGQGAGHTHSHSHRRKDGGDSHEIGGGELNWKKFLASNIGILTGFTAMFLLAFFEENIRF